MLSAYGIAKTIPNLGTFPCYERRTERSLRMSCEVSVLSSYRHETVMASMRHRNQPGAKNLISFPVDGAAMPCGIYTQLRRRAAQQRATRDRLTLLSIHWSRATTGILQTRAEARPGERECETLAMTHLDGGVLQVRSA